MMAEVGTEIEPAAAGLLSLGGVSDELVAMASIAVSLRKIALCMMEPTITHELAKAPFKAPTKIPNERYENYMHRLVTHFEAWANGEKL